MAGHQPGHLHLCCRRSRLNAPSSEIAGGSAGCSMAAMRFFTAFCTFSKARTSIWRTRSRETPNSAARSSSVIGSSARRRASKMRFSRSLSTSSAEISALWRLSLSSLSARMCSWFWRVVDQPVHPFAGFAVVADRRVERGVAAETAVHVDHVLLGDAKTLGDQLDLIGLEIAFLERGDLALGLAQVEEQLLLIGGGAHFHQRPRAQDVFLDRGLDPPHGVGREPEALFGLEALDRLHQADIAFGDDFRNRQAVAAIAHGDLGHEAQMAGDELVRGFTIAVLAPAARQHVFLLRFQHREPADFFQIV